jgi:hypothetical protein
MIPGCAPAERSSAIVRRSRNVTSVTLVQHGAWILLAPLSAGLNKNDEMTLKIARTTDTPVSATDKKPTGWDPFEVWRTRVLLPRIAESTASTGAKTGSQPVSLVPRKR